MSPGSPQAAWEPCGHGDDGDVGEVDDGDVGDGDVDDNDVGDGDVDGDGVDPLALLPGVLPVIDVSRGFGI